MNLSRVIEITDELKALKKRETELRNELAKEALAFKEVFPTDFTKKKEAHEDKYAPSWGTPPKYWGHELQYYNQSMATHLSPTS